MSSTIGCVHLTVVHPRHDTRIYLKEVTSLSKEYESVGLLVADGLGDAKDRGIQVLDLGKPKGGRLGRAFLGSVRAFRKIRLLRPSVVHFHDPELMPLGFLLRLTGTKVIYDVHEDLPRQILSKQYIPSVARIPVASAVSVLEWLAGRLFTAIVAATPTIARRFPQSKTTTVQNFPMLKELASDVAWTEKRGEVCYIGGISAIRGIREVVAAMEISRSGARLNIGGRFENTALETEVKNSPGWEKVNELGFVDRSGVREVLGRSVGGLVTFLPLPNHVDAQPNKMFEYMSAGIPVIASDFPLWREIIEGADCGLCVDPAVPAEIAAAIDRLVEEPELAQRMGENGRKAVLEKYNWPVEEKKLLDLYASFELKAAK